MKSVAIEIFLSEIRKHCAIYLIENMEIHRRPQIDFDTTDFAFDFDEEQVVVDYYDKGFGFPITFTFKDFKILLLGHFSEININIHELQQLLQHDYPVWNVRYEALKKYLVERSNEIKGLGVGMAIKNR